MGLGDVHHQAQADAGAADLLVPVRTVEALEDPPLGRVGDAGAVVAHPHLNEVADLLDGHGDRGAVAVLHRVVEEVVQRQHDRLLVHLDLGDVAEHLEVHVDALALHPVAEGLDGTAHDRLEVAPGEGVGLLASLEGGEVEHVLDQAREALGLPQDDLEVLLPFLLGSHAVGQQELAEHPHHRERRLQLVADVGDEVALQLGQPPLLRGCVEQEADAEDDDHQGDREQGGLRSASAPALGLEARRLLRSDLQPPVVEGGREAKPHQVVAGVRQARAVHPPVVLVDDVVLALPLLGGEEIGELFAHDGLGVVAGDDVVSAAPIAAADVGEQIAATGDGVVQVLEAATSQSRQIHLREQPLGEHLHELALGARPVASGRGHHLAGGVDHHDRLHARGELARDRQPAFVEQLRVAVRPEQLLQVHEPEGGVVLADHVALDGVDLLAHEQERVLGDGLLAELGVAGGGEPGRVPEEDRGREDGWHHHEEDHPVAPAGHAPSS